MISKIKIPNLAIVTICKNEELLLPEFLDHLVDWVEEIIVIDDNSADGSVPILAEYQKRYPGIIAYKVVVRKEEEYFSDLRNYGIKLSTSEWILHMDVDERVTAHFYSEIKNIFFSEIIHSQFDAFKFRRLNYFLSKPMYFGDLSNWNKVHLSRRHILKFEGLNHEIISLNTSEDRIGQLKKRMVHLNERFYLQRLDKSRRYLNDLVNEINHKYQRLFGFYFILLFPVLFFTKLYFFQLGFLDGKRGLVWAIHSSVARFQACVLIYYDLKLKNSSIIN